MAYLALYRKYRPRTFDQLIGQNVITTTLNNSINNQTTSHAYLFTGPRGTGKTSAALIFARTVNGLSETDDLNQYPDIIEIDAASNNGVDEIRSIRESSNYAPVELPYKIYIIDEVHMLSTGAFNALLKTLEEPPAQVKFLLATTDPQKVPATILSRVQRFDFKRISKDQIISRLKDVFEKEQIEYDDAALEVIAKTANGGMRDALSLSDQIYSFASKIDLQATLELTGSADEQELVDYLKLVIANDTVAAIEKMKKMINNGKDPQRIVEDSIGILHDNLIGNNQYFENINQEQTIFYIDVLSEISSQLKLTSRPEVYMDVLTMKLINKKIEASTIISATTQIASAVEKPQEAEVLKIKTHSNQDLFSVLATAQKDELVSVNDAWQDIIEQLNIKLQALINDTQVVAASKDALIVAFEYQILLDKAQNSEALKLELNNILKSKLDSEYQLHFVSNADWQKTRTEYIEQNNKNKKEIDPISAAKSIFGDDVQVVGE